MSRPNIPHSKALLTLESWRPGISSVMPRTYFENESEYCRHLTCVSILPNALPGLAVVARGRRPGQDAGGSNTAWCLPELQPLAHSREKKHLRDDKGIAS